MKQFEPYLEFSEFDSIVKKDGALRAAAIEEAETLFEVVPPENYQAGKKYPLFMILHGGGSDMAKQF